MNRLPLTDKDGEVRELTEDDLTPDLKPLAEIDPELIEAMRRRRGGRPKVEAPKVHMGFRIAAELAEGIKATGKGYNSRVEKVLREALTSGRLID